MEVYVQMAVREDEVDFGRLPSFWVLGFYPGAMQKNFRNGQYWLEWMDDKSVLPIAHIMERAFKLNRLVVFKKPDDITQKLIRANLNKTRLDASIAISIRTGKGDTLWQGNYKFDFFIEQMLANQSDGDGNKWETLQLKILDGTEKMALDE
jgi:hypothetical protein